MLLIYFLDLDLKLIALSAVLLAMLLGLYRVLFRLFTHKRAVSFWFTVSAISEEWGRRDQPRTFHCCKPSIAEAFRTWLSLACSRFFAV